MTTDPMSYTLLLHTRESCVLMHACNTLSWDTWWCSGCRDLRKVLNCEVVQLDTMQTRGGGGNSKIVVAWLPYKNVVPTMLFSHGNAVDLGQMLPFYRLKAHTFICI